MQYKSYRIVEEKARWVIVDENKKIINKNPSIDELVHLHIEIEEDFFIDLELKYGKEFSDWAKHNGRKLEMKILKAGCKSEYEYREKLAIKKGFNDLKEHERIRAAIWRQNNKEHWNEYIKNWKKLNRQHINESNNERRYNSGKSLPMELNEECSSYFGIWIAENYIIKTFDNPIRMPYGNPGYDWICNKGFKIQCKAACLDWYDRWIFPIRWNNIADIFLLSAWDNRDSLIPLYIWIFHKHDIVRGKKFNDRGSFSIFDTPGSLEQLRRHEVTNKLEKLRQMVMK